jgi:hypothetical protein
LERKLALRKTEECFLQNFILKAQVPIIVSKLSEADNPYEAGEVSTCNDAARSLFDLGENVEMSLR